jgi:hypothetical protein
MVKELKYLFFILVIFLFFFLSFKFYFSDVNRKNSYRSLKNANKITIEFSKKLTLLENNTKDTLEYVEETINKDKKNYKFLELLNNND